MAKTRGEVLVDDRAALEHYQRAEELREQAANVETEVERLLAPIRDRLGELVLERDRLLYEAIAARQKFFAAARKIHPELNEHRGLDSQVRADKIYVEWDDTGPHYTTGESAEVPSVHAFSERRPGRRAWDLTFWLR